MIFDLIKNQPIIRVESLTIPEIYKIWDETEDKNLAHLKLCYIYHVADPRSPYSKLAKEDREKEVKKDFAKSFTVDKSIKNAVAKYEMLNTTVISRSFESVKDAISGINNYLKNNSKSITDENIETVMKALEKMEKFSAVYASTKKAAENDIDEEKVKYKRGIVPSDILTLDDDSDGE